MPSFIPVEALQPRGIVGAQLNRDVAIGEALIGLRQPKSGFWIIHDSSTGEAFEA